jgi:single-strand DNA-binding protein
VNKVILIGRLGADPETRVTAGGTTVANLRLATSERRKENGEWVEATEWHRLVAFGKTAENVAQYRAKGSELAVEGRIQTNKWQDKEGNDRYTTEIVCDRLEFIGGKAEPKPEAKPQEAPKSQQGVEPFSDDIPFARRHWLS